MSTEGRPAEDEGGGPGIATASRTEVARPGAVALVVSHLRGGGKEQCVVDLANGLGQGDFDPIVVCLGAGGALEQRIRRDRVRVLTLGKRPGNDVGLPIRLARLLRREGVALVHSNNWGTLAESVIAARLAGIRRVVHTQHGLDYGAGDAPSNDRHRLRILAKRLMARKVDRVVAVSTEVRDMMTRDWRVPPERISVIHNGVALPERRLDDRARCERRRAIGLDPGDLVVGSVGIFRPVKDFTTLVEAMAEVVREIPRAVLVLIGDGPSRGEIEAAVDRLGLASHVRFLGLRLDVDQLLPLLDVFALCSISEGLSLSILEAMAAGVPVVATAVGGNPEIIDSETVGVLAPARSPSMVAQALVGLLGDGVRRRAMGASARARVEGHFSLARMTADYARLYAGVAR